MVDTYEDYGRATRDALLATCVHCGNDTELRDGKRAEVNAWGDDRDFQCGVSDNGRHETIGDYLARDTGDAPGSRYGTRARDWSPVAIAVAVIMAAETGNGYPSPDIVDHAASLVVNDHEDAEHLIVNYGPEYGYGANELLSHDWHVEDMASPDAVLSVGDIIIDGAAPRSVPDRIYRLLDYARGYVPHPTDAALLEAASTADDAASPSVHGDYEDIMPDADSVDIAQMLSDLETDIRDYLEAHIVPHNAYLASPDPGDVIVWCAGCAEYEDDGGNRNPYDMTLADYDHADGCDAIGGDDA